VVSLLSKLIKCVVNKTLDKKFHERAELQNAVSKPGIENKIKEKNAN
jgi:hypothetical protein